ncbi:MAG TPA: hypothetical protein PLQ76_04310 [bacterium]|nr:hypothetical protein [bacterium]
MNIRVWAEFFSPEDAREKKVVKLLKKYDVTLGMAFPPGSMNESYAKMLADYDRAGVSVMLWVLLPDTSGYWACERNYKEFSDYVDRIYEWADKKKFNVPWLAVDLEPPYYQLQKVKNSKLPVAIGNAVENLRENRNRGRFYDASSGYNRLVEKLHSRKVKTLTAADFKVVEDFKLGTIGHQDAMETPISTVNWDIVSFMIYNSMMVGYSKGLVSMKDARWYLFSAMQDMKKVLWDRAGVSIGVTYIGKLGDEPYYETPADMLPDVQAVKAALIDDVSVFNLEGILRSDKPEEWFEMIIGAEANVPEISVKANVFRLVLQAASAVL